MLRKNCTQTEMERVKASKFFFSIVFAVGISFQHTYYVHVGKKVLARAYFSLDVAPEQRNRNFGISSSSEHRTKIRYGIFLIKDVLCIERESRFHKPQSCGTTF